MKSLVDSFHRPFVASHSEAFLPTFDIFLMALDPSVYRLLPAISSHGGRFCLPSKGETALKQLQIQFELVWMEIKSSRESTPVLLELLNTFKVNRPGIGRAHFFTFRVCMSSLRLLKASQVLPSATVPWSIEERISGYLKWKTLPVELERSETFD